MEISKNLKLVTSGCSFADTMHGNAYKTWPQHLHEIFSSSEWYNEGRGGQSDNLIRMRTIYRVSELLKTNKPEDLFVVVMWTGPDRIGVYYNKKDFNEPKSGFVWVDPHNFVKEDTDGYWKPLIAGHRHRLQEIYYGNFHDSIGSVINLLHDILYVQTFLEKNNVKYIMTTAWNILEFKWDNWGLYKGDYEKYVGKNIGSHEVLNHPDLKWISDLIKWDMFTPVEGEWEWISHYNPNRNPLIDHHPTQEEHKAFTENVIIPFIHEKY